MGIGVCDACRLHWKKLFEDLQRFSPQGLPARRLVRSQYITDLLINSKRRMKRQRRLLKDQRNARTSDAFERARFCAQQVQPLEKNGTPLDLGIPGEQPQ